MLFILNESGDGLFDEEDLFEDVFVDDDDVEHVDDEEWSSLWWAPGTPPPVVELFPARNSSDDDVDDADEPDVLFLLPLLDDDFDLLDFFERSLEASLDGVEEEAPPLAPNESDEVRVESPGTHDSPLFDLDSKPLLFDIDVWSIIPLEQFDGLLTLSVHVA